MQSIIHSWMRRGQGKSRPTASRLVFGAPGSLVGSVGVLSRPGSNNAARDLAEPFPTQSLDDDAMTAARLPAEQRSPEPIACSEDDRPYNVLPGSHVLNLIIPRFVQGSAGPCPCLRRTGPRHAARQTGQLYPYVTSHPNPQNRMRYRSSTRTPPPSRRLRWVIARMQSPLVAVVDTGGCVLGAITVPKLLSHFLPT
jgi:hypothetical protein